MDETVFAHAKEFVERLFEGDSGGHDIWHTIRVHDLAVTICREEGGDMDVVRLAALLHARDEHGLEIGTGGVDGCRVARRTGTDDNNRCVYALAHGVSFQIRAEGRASARPRDGFFRL